MISNGICWRAIIVVAAMIIAHCQTFALNLERNKDDDGPLVADELLYVKPGISVAQLLEVRGYKAQESTFTTRDGYILRITRGTNPLINGGERGLDHKLPILFVHGTTVPSTTFILNSVGVRPRVYDTNGLDMSQMTLEQLSKIVHGDPSVKSLPFLAMNFGYEIWILDRRGSLGSRGKVGHENRTIADALRSLPESLFGNLLDLPEPPSPLQGESTETPEGQISVETDGSGRANETDSGSEPSTSRSASSWGRSGRSKRPNILQAFFSVAKINLRNRPSTEIRIRQFVETFDPDYWRFSLDEQVEFDFPEAIDFVLNTTGKQKLHVVGMSVGGTITLLALANQPELANKISKAILWSPTIIVGPNTFGARVSKLLPLVKGFIGALPLPLMMPELETYFLLVCSSEFTSSTICEIATDKIIGSSGGQAPMSLFVAGHLFRPTGIMELTQLSQFTRPEAPCKLQLNSRADNIKKYGQPNAPCYDLGQIKLHNMSVYTGANDAFAPIEDVRVVVGKLKVPFKLNFINESGIYFNHIGYFLHKQLDRLVILPSLLDLERSEAQESNRLLRSHRSQCGC